MGNSLLSGPFWQVLSHKQSKSQIALTKGRYVAGSLRLQDETGGETFPVQVTVQPRSYTARGNITLEVSRPQGVSRPTLKNTENNPLCCPLALSSSLISQRFPAMVPHNEEQAYVFLWAFSFFRLEGDRGKKQNKTKLMMSCCVLLSTADWERSKPLPKSSL